MSEPKRPTALEALQNWRAARAEHWTDEDDAGRHAALVAAEEQLLAVIPQLEAEEVWRQPTMEQLSQIGLNPFAVALLQESMNTRPEATASWARYGPLRFQFNGVRFTLLVVDHYEKSPIQIVQAGDPT